MLQPPCLAAGTVSVRGKISLMLLVSTALALSLKASIAEGPDHFWGKEHPAGRMLQGLAPENAAPGGVAQNPFLLLLIEQGDFEAARRQLQQTTRPPPRPPPGPHTPPSTPPVDRPVVPSPPPVPSPPTGAVDMPPDPSVVVACAPPEKEYMTGARHTDMMFCASLLVLSGLFSGLTLGLMSLTVADLEIYIQSEKPHEDAPDYEERMTESRYAAKILPLRKRGNLLLCTLLLGNTLVNALIAILSATFTGGMLGAVFSTGFIVIFGEISPQAVCSRYGLMIGAYTIGIVKVFMVCLIPVAFPISLVLDYVLGEEVGMGYDKQELAMLVEQQAIHQHSNVDSHTTNLLKGALMFGQKTVKDIMTSRKQLNDRGVPGTWMLDIRKKLDFDTMLEIYKTGYTRIPICDGSESDPNSPIVGLLLTKDLMLVDPEDEIDIGLLLSFCGRDIVPIPENEKLDIMLKKLTNSKTKTHLFFVQPEAEYRKDRPIELPERPSLADRRDLNDEEDSPVAGAEGSTGLYPVQEQEDVDDDEQYSKGGGSAPGPLVYGGPQPGMTSIDDNELAQRLLLLTVSDLFMRGRNLGMREDRLAKSLDSKMALVELIVEFERSIERGERKPLNNVTGIVTIEDLLEELIQAEIQDETDIYISNVDVTTVARGRREQRQMEAREEFFKHMVDPKRSKQKRRTNLSHEETVVLVDFLDHHVTAFRDYRVHGGGEFSLSYNAAHLA